jgi:hypothetical protein
MKKDIVINKGIESIYETERQSKRDRDNVYVLSLDEDDNLNFYLGGFIIATLTECKSLGVEQITSLAEKAIEVWYFLKLISSKGDKVPYMDGTYKELNIAYSMINSVS